MGVSPNEYCVLDIYYQSQVNPKYSVGGYAANSYAEMSRFLGFSKGAIHAMVDRFVERGLMEVDPSNPYLKRTTEAWYGVAYEDRAVQKSNAIVQKVNGTRSKIERHNKEEIKEENKRNINPLTPKGELSTLFDEVRKSYPGTKRGLRPEFETLKKAAKKSKTPVAELIEEIKAAIQNQKSWRAQQKNRGKFVPQWPHLSTWLNQQRWTEEPPEGISIASGESQSNPGGLLPAAAWKDWPQINGWIKTHIPGTYSCSLNGPMDFKTMIANRMARPGMFPSALLANQTQAAA